MIVRGIKIGRRSGSDRKVLAADRGGRQRLGKGRRGGQDAPWRIRVRSAVRLLRLGA